MKFSILFPGQGSQYIGMYSKLLKNYKKSKEIFDEASEILGFNLQGLIENGNMKELTSSENAQPAVVATSYALFCAFMEQIGENPSYGVGHSLGEISALIASNSLSFSDGIRYVKKRGEIMNRAIKDNVGGAGVVVDMSEEVLERLVKDVKRNDYISISGYNSPNQFIVAGSREGILSLEDRIDQEDGQLIPFKMVPMKVDAPYHSSLMGYLKEELDEMLKTMKINSPIFPIWSTVTGKILKSPSEISEVLGKQIVSPVLWNQALKNICDNKVELLIDMGPDQIIKNLIKENKMLPESFAFDNENDKIKILNLFEKN